MIVLGVAPWIVTLPVAGSVERIAAIARTVIL